MNRNDTNLTYPVLEQHKITKKKNNICQISCRRISLFSSVYCYIDEEYNHRSCLLQDSRSKWRWANDKLRTEWMRVDSKKKKNSSPCRWWILPWTIYLSWPRRLPTPGFRRPHLCTQPVQLNSIRKQAWRPFECCRTSPPLAPHHQFPSNAWIRVRFFLEFAIHWLHAFCLGLHFSVVSRLRVQRHCCRLKYKFIAKITQWHLAWRERNETKQKCSHKSQAKVFLLFDTSFCVPINFVCFLRALSLSLCRSQRTIPSIFITRLAFLLAHSPVRSKFIALYPANSIFRNNIYICVCKRK